MQDDEMFDELETSSEPPKQFIKGCVPPSPPLPPISDKLDLSPDTEIEE